MLMFFHRMPTPPSGSQIISSDQPREKRKNKRHWRKRHKRLIQTIKKMKLTRPEAKMTWTQIRLLTQNAKHLLIEQKKPLTDPFFFIAFLSLISAPLPGMQEISYWAYMPNPPIIQPIG